jgi:hypothetical protein
MKYILLVLLAVVMSVSPAKALNGYAPYYWVVYGYSYPKDLVAGPYDNDPGQYNAYSKCSYVASVYARNDPQNGYQYHCELQ